MALITSDCPPHADAIRVSLVLCSAGGGQDRANLVRPPRRPGWISALLLRMVTPPGPGAVHYADFYGVGAAEETPRSKFPHTALFWCCGVALPSPHSLGSCSPPCLHYVHLCRFTARRRSRLTARAVFGADTLPLLSNCRSATDRTL